MTTWRSYHVFYSDIDPLILAGVQPALDRLEGRVERRFWERHFAGGPHLRIRLGGEAAAVEAAGAELTARLAAFLAAHPSRDLDSYDPARAARLLEWEGTPAEEADDLGYRNNRIEEHPYPPRTDAYVTREASRLMEDFRHDALPFAVRLLRGSRPRREALLRLYFLHALHVGGSLPQGSVSFKSHWEGFASSFPSADAIERIQATYQANREAIAALLLEVEGLFSTGRLAEDPDLADWSRLLAVYEARARATILSGTHITPQAASPEEAARMRERAESSRRRDSEFVRTFWSSEVFVASIQFEPSFLVPRVLTNLLYALLSAAGLKPIDKFSLCHFASRAVEEHAGCDLTQFLRDTVDRFVTRNAARWSPAASSQPGV